ncbi:M24 family metallopeptidase [Desulfotignum balticum]|uniref:M24 family metallopeptidase n=1 Tax=Desulfotignum balticum TaxID=115781 RepID=UPI00046289FC|nr:Xaa-Pro peptidase family protein [Desulfotignum balticum]
MIEASPKLTFGTRAADWTEGINFSRMRKDRLARTHAALKQNDITACLLTRPENIRYATAGRGLDFIDQSRYALITEKNEPIFYESHGTLAGIHPWVNPENIRQSFHWANQACGPTAVWESAKKFADSIKQELKTQGLEKEKIGIDTVDEPGRLALKEAGIKTVNAMPVMLEARAVKTQDELNCLRMAVAITEIGWCAIYDALRPGVRDCDLVAAAHEAMYKAGIEDIWMVILSSGGPPQVMDKIIRVGDVVTVDFVRCTYMGYNTCWYRNTVVGKKPSAQQMDKYKRMNDRLYKVLDAIKPGVTTAEVARLWEPADQKGFTSEEAAWCDDMGHGIGLSLYEYPVTNRLWSLDHPQTYEKGMTIAVEALDTIDPSLGRIKVEEMVVVTDNGVQILNTLPSKGLMVAHPIQIAE